MAHKRKSKSKEIAETTATSKAYKSWDWDTSQKIIKPLHSNYKQVLSAFDPYTASVRLKMPTESFGHLEGFTTVENPYGKYFFKDNGANVLAVAHLDSVHEKDVRFVHGRTTLSKRIAFLSHTVDDRLGAYIILDLLKEIGIDQYDILLTEGEEVGMSTAMYFETEKKYNWMFSFDREGIDVVLYQYDTPALRDKLKGVGFKVAHGSFSDICFLDELGCSGINFGTGYYDNHSKDAYFVKSHTLNMVARFAEFWNLYKDSAMPYQPTSQWSRGKNARSYSTVWNSRDIDDDYYWMDNYSTRWTGKTRSSYWRSYEHNYASPKEPADVVCRTCWYNNKSPSWIVGIGQHEMRTCQKCGNHWYRSYNVTTINKVVLTGEEMTCAYCRGKLVDGNYKGEVKCQICEAIYYAIKWPDAADKETLQGLRLVPYQGIVDKIEKNVIELEEVRHKLKQPENTKAIAVWKPDLIDGHEPRKEELVWCDWCGGSYYPDELEDAQNGWRVCEWCLRMDFDKCDTCNGYHLRYEECKACQAITDALDAEQCFVCKRSAIDVFLRWRYTKGDLSFRLCDDCKETHIATCAVCGHPFFRVGEHDVDKLVCGDCKNKPVI